VSRDDVTATLLASFCCLLTRYTLARQKYWHAIRGMRPPYTKDGR